MRGSDKVIWSAVWNEQKRIDNANVDIVLYAIGMQFQSKRVEFFQVNHSFDQIRKGEELVVDRWETEFSRKIVQEIFKKLKHHEKFVVQKLK